MIFAKSKVFKEQKKSYCCDFMEKKEKAMKIIESRNVLMKGWTLIEGFPDLGLAGTIGARYLVEKLKFEQIGYIDSDLFLPIIRIDNGLPIHPVRVYGSKKHKLVVVISEQIIDNKMAPFIAKELIEWIKKKGITRVISTSGVRMPEGKSVYAFASDEKSKKIVKDNKIEMINEGVTSGVTALLMLYLKDNKIEAFCLLGNARNNADYNAAAEVVKVICNLTEITLDVSPLLEEAKKLEEALTKHLKTLEEQKQNDGKPDVPATPMCT